MITMNPFFQKWWTTEDIPPEWDLIPTVNLP